MNTGRMSKILMSFIGMLVVSVAMAGSYGKQKVVYHINYDNPKTQAGALRNIQNHINAVGAENLELKVVLHGKGVSLLLEPDAAMETKLALGNATDEIQAKISGLKEQGVGFHVCANTLKGKKVILTEHLYDTSDSDVVPSGVAELAKLQAEGYTYIKP
ncbi:MAG: DsrE family protein [Candidatus Thiodiazotropha sp.]|nr:DsrE family protein [Candidatus Thiodiazotropha sp.]